LVELLKGASPKGIIIGRHFPRAMLLQ
jgi:hypothetical protein